MEFLGGAFGFGFEDFLELGFFEGSFVAVYGYFVVASQ